MFDKAETLKVYAYDHEGNLLGERTLDYTDRSPISGFWQIPANMTTEKPPKEKNGYKIIFKVGKWALVKIPEPAVEPTPLQPTEEELMKQEYDRILNNLKESLVIASLLGDETRMAAIRQEYKELIEAMNQSEEEEK